MNTCDLIDSSMVAVLEIGAFSETTWVGPSDAVVTSLLAAPLADNYGRRITLRSGAFIFTLGGAIQTFCSGFYTMILGRVISGFGVGMLSMVVPIYQVGSFTGSLLTSVRNLACGSC